MIFGRRRTGSAFFPGLFVVLFAAASFNAWAQLIVDLFVLAGFFVYLRFLYRWLDRIDVRLRAEQREKYRGIYRVKAPPVSDWTWLKENNLADRLSAALIRSSVPSRT